MMVSDFNDNSLSARQQEQRLTEIQNKISHAQSLLKEAANGIENFDEATNGDGIFGGYGNDMARDINRSAEGKQVFIEMIDKGIEHLNATHDISI